MPKQMQPIVCPECGGDNLRFMVDAILLAPVREFYGKLTRTNLRSKEVRLVGVNWDHASFICPECGWSTHQEEAERLGPAMAAEEL